MKYKENPLKRKYGHHVHSTSKPSKANIKKQIRDLSRVSKKSAVDSREIQRKITGLKQQLIDIEKNQKIDSLEKKYKYVKFVEATKLNRKLKKAGKEEMQEIQDKLLYIEHYPKDMKYISILAAEPNALRDKIMQRIKNATEQELETGIFMKNASDALDESEQEEADDFFIA